MIADQAREILARLVGFPTISRDSNAPLIAYVQSYLRGYGVESHLVHGPDGKANLFATVGASVPGGVVLSGHTDVVPVDGQAWTGSPWQLTERDGRLYGRGTSDMKGFVALMLALVPHAAAASLQRPIHLALSYDEEVGCQGAPSLVRAMAEHVPAPSAVIVGEPTRMTVVSGHKSCLTAFTEVTGHAVHSSQVHTGVSAVAVAARLISWLEDRLRENGTSADPESLFEPPFTTLHCGMIQGGIAPNIVAADCWFSTDIRALPSEDARTYLAAYRRYIDETVLPPLRSVAPSVSISVRERSHTPAFRPAGSSAAERLARGLTGDNAVRMVPYGTEAGIFQKAGWDVVVCGPGDINQAHKPDEFIEITQLETGGRFMEALLRKLS